jgi:hypothetical protein
MKRIVVRVYAGDAKTKGNPLAESTSFFGTALGAPGGSNAVDWTQGSTAIPTANGTAGIGAAGAGTAVATGTSATGTAVTPTPQATPQ